MRLLLFSTFGYEVATIGSQFSFVDRAGETLRGIPPYPPMFSFSTFSEENLFTIPTLAEFKLLLFPAIAIAFLAAMEFLLSATIADSMAGTKHDSDAELSAIGIGNIFSALASGLPATGAIARTALAVNNGEKTPLSSTIHAVLILFYVLMLSPYIAYIPMAALAALLIHIAYCMSHYKQFIHTVRIAPPNDVIVLFVCFLLTVFVNMVAGVGVGMICTAVLLINRVTGLSSVEVAGNVDGLEQASVELPEGTMLYCIQGPIFFGTVERVFGRYQFTHDFVDHLVLDMREVPFIDMTGLVALESMLASIAHEERKVSLICNKPYIIDKIRRKIVDHEVARYVSFYDQFDEAVSVP